MKEEKLDEGLIPEASEEDIRETEELIGRAKGKAPTPSETGNLECPVCGGIMQPSEELVFDVHLPNGYVVIPNLSGHKCEKCGDKYFDPDSSSIIDEYTTGRVSGGQLVEITNHIIHSGETSLLHPCEHVLPVLTSPAREPSSDFPFILSSSSGQMSSTLFK